MAQIFKRLCFQLEDVRVWHKVVHAFFIRLQGAIPLVIGGWPSKRPMTRAVNVPASKPVVLCHDNQTCIADEVWMKRTFGQPGLFGSKCVRPEFFRGPGFSAQRVATPSGEEQYLPLLLPPLVPSRLCSSASLPPVSASPQFSQRLNSILRKSWVRLNASVRRHAHRIRSGLDSVDFVIVSPPFSFSSSRLWASVSFVI